MVSSSSTAVRAVAGAVLEAASGEDALPVAREHIGQPIELLVTDMVMPHSGGKALAERLRDVRPEIRVLVMSGYVDAVIAEQVQSTPHVGFLQKPFLPEQLARRIRQLLDA